MKPTKKSKTFTSAKDFRQALEDRLLRASNNDQTKIQKLRRQAAFDRLLARLFSISNPPFALKGGYAMQLRLKESRTTRDLDLTMKETQAGFLDMLRAAAEVDLRDFFTFQISAPIKDLNAAPYGGARYHVEARLDGRTFEKFHLDVGIGDVWIEPLEKLEANDWFEFAGLSSPAFLTISSEQQFAEKVHAYSLPRGDGRLNSRVKDLVDLVLLIDSDTLDAKRITPALAATFNRRDTHKLPNELLPPPTAWKNPFAAMAAECSIDTDMNAAFEKVFAYFSKLKKLK